MATLHLGSEGSANDGVNGYVGIGTTSPSEALEVTGNIKMTGGGYNNGHLKLGAYHLWVDPLGKVRIKNGPPLGPQDGNLV